MNNRSPAQSLSLQCLICKSSPLQLRELDIPELLLHFRCLFFSPRPHSWLHILQADHTLQAEWERRFKACPIVQPSQECQSHNQIFTTWTVGLVAILSLFLVARTSLKSLGSMTRAHLHQRRWQIRKSSPPLPSASGRCHMCGSKGTKIPRLTKRAILLQQHDCLRSSNTLQLKLQNSER